MASRHSATSKLPFSPILFMLASQDLIPVAKVDGDYLTTMRQWSCTGGWEVVKVFVTDTTYDLFVERQDRCQRRCCSTNVQSTYRGQITDTIRIWLNRWITSDEKEVTEWPTTRGPRLFSPQPNFVPCGSRSA